MAVKNQRGGSMQHVRIAARGIKRERIENYMDNLIHARRLEEEDVFLWPNQELKKNQEDL